MGPSRVSCHGQRYHRGGDALGIGEDLASYEDLQKASDLRWPVVDGQETRYRYSAGHDPYVKKREGVHFYKAQGYGEKAAFWLRLYHPAAEEPDKEYLFGLTTGARRWSNSAATGPRPGTGHAAARQSRHQR